MTSAETAAPASARLEGNAWRLCLIRLLFWMHLFAAVLVPFYTDWGGVSLADVFVINAWFFLCNFALEVPTGTVADYLSRRTSLILGSVVAAGGVLFYAWRPGLGHFLLAEVFMAVAYTLHSGADEALAYDSLKALGREREAARLIARMEAFKLGGIVAATVLGGFVAATWGLRAPMLVTCVPMALAALVALGLVEPPGGAGGRRSYLSILREGGRVFLRQPAVRRLAVEAALTNAVAWAIIWLFQPLLQRASLPLSAFGVVHALGCLAQIAFLSAVPALERACGSRRLLLRVTTLAGAGCFALLAATTAWPLVGLGIVAGMTFGLTRVPLFSAAVNHHVASGERATVLSFCGMVRQAAIVVLNPLTGWLAERSLPGALLAMAGAFVLAAWLSRVIDADFAPSQPAA